MTDFMKWLYENYIDPQVKAAPQGDYAAYFSLLENTLERSLVPSHEKVLEFTAIHAFLLGLRTGRGLSGE